MKKTSIAVIVFCFSLISVQAQYNYEWTAHFGGTNTDYSYALAVDNEGNVITGGEFRYTIDFDPSEEGEAPITVSSSPNGYISKLDANGAYVWARVIEGEARVLDIHTDNDGNVYACGRFRQTVDFLQGAEEWLLTSIGQYDMFLAKYSADGDLEWVFGIGGIYQDYMTGITVDANGDLVVCGKFTDAVDFDPSKEIEELIETGGNTQWDSFVAKYDSDGNYIWARKFEGDGLQEAAGVHVNSDGDIIMAGQFSTEIDCDPSDDNELIFESGSELDWQGYIVKLTADGDLVWAKSFGSATHEWLSGVSIDELDNIYVAGAFNSTADFDPGEAVFNMAAEGSTSDGYVSKFDTDGNFLWAGQFAGTDDGGCYTIDAAFGAIYIGGYGRGACDYNPGAEENIEGQGTTGYYGFIAVLSTQGEYLWSDRLGNGGGDYCYNILADEEYLYATGTFKGTTVWFGNNQSYSSNGHDDIYVTKILHPSNVSAVQEMNSVFNLYPNPTTDNIYITGIKGYADIMMFDVSGKMVLNERITNNASLNTSHLETGVYTLTIKTTDAIETKKIMVVR